VLDSNNAEFEVSQANYPNIHVFQVPRIVSTTPNDTVNSSWDIVSPEMIKRTNCTAAGYFFGRQIHKDINVPVGLIQSDWGGTIAEAWTSAEALKKMPDFRKAVNNLENYNKEKGSMEYAERLVKWWNDVDPVSQKKLGWQKPEFDDSSWQTTLQPKYWDSGELAKFYGIAWFRKAIDVPAELAGKAAVLDLGPIDDGDTAYVNGTAVGSSMEWNEYRRYPVPEGLLKQGKNTITVRVFNTLGPGGMYTTSSEGMTLKIGDTSISLNGDWKYKLDIPKAQIKLDPPASFGANPNIVTMLYNAMIAPLIPYGIKGAIWYQGESNADRPMQYRTLLPTMINDWRSRFGVGKFPFYIVQLANFFPTTTDPVQSGWAELREAQLLTAEKTPNCGMAVITDIGDAVNIHPLNKQDVGYRLALAAEAITYGKKIVYSGPVYTKKKVEGSVVRLYFKHIGGGLVAKDGSLKGFAIAGKDKKFVWADAKIDGDTIVVSSPSVEKPVAVRYNWANNPIGNLFNTANLPASCFRTDME
jgi:sialate O-acetylesterase